MWQIDNIQHTSLLSCRSSSSASFNVLYLDKSSGTSSTHDKKVIEININEEREYKYTTKYHAKKSWLLNGLTITLPEFNCL